VSTDIDEPLTSGEERVACVRSVKVRSEELAVWLHAATPRGQGNNIASPRKRKMHAVGL